MKTFWMKYDPRTADFARNRIFFHFFQSADFSLNINLIAQTNSGVFFHV